MIALQSEYPRLTPEQQAKVRILIVDDGDWSEEQIRAYVENHWGWAEPLERPEDWTKK